MQESSGSGETGAQVATSGPPIDLQSLVIEDALTEREKKLLTILVPGKSELDPRADYFPSDDKIVVILSDRVALTEPTKRVTAYLELYSSRVATSDYAGFQVWGIATAIQEHLPNFHCLRLNHVRVTDILNFLEEVHGKKIFGPFREWIFHTAGIYKLRVNLNY